jgi:hypothetical protein
MFYFRERLSEGLWLSMALWLYGSMALWLYGSMGHILNVSISYTVMRQSRYARMMAYVIIFLITPAGFWPDEVPDKSVTDRYRDII